ncbi:hypothetical protein SAMN04487852_11394 [Prevotella sp. tf2-5]|nr:hypothetical protein SAMN04487852_11394 [Prevotella sp. tf2-5]
MNGRCCQSVLITVLITGMLEKYAYYLRNKML